MSKDFDLDTDSYRGEMTRTKAMAVGADTRGECAGRNSREVLGGSHKKTTNSIKRLLMIDVASGKFGMDGRGERKDWAFLLILVYGLDMSFILQVNERSSVRNERTFKSHSWGSTGCGNLR